MHVAPNLDLPPEAVTQTFALLARRGAGKTHTASVLAEEMLKAGHAIIWLDPIGVAWGLRSHFPVAILGGEHADAPLEPTGGKIVAEFLVAHRVPTILDVSCFGENEMRRFVADFAQRFYERNRDPVHLFIDEADEFAPQDGSGKGPMAACLGAMQNIVRRGRARGIGVTLITQRSAVLNKSVLTQTECLIAMQTTAPHDLKAIESWIKYHGTPEQCKMILDTLPKLQQGEAWVYSPGWLKILERVKFRPRTSFDSSRTPAPGEKRQTPKTLAEVDLSKLAKEMAVAIERAKADDPALLRKEIAALKKQLAAKPAKVAAEADQETVARAVRAAIVERDRAYQAALKELRGQVAEARKVVAKVAADSGNALMRIFADVPEPSRNGNNSVHTPQPVATKSVAERPAKEPVKYDRNYSENDTLPKGETAVLSALIQFPDGLKRNQLTVLTAYKRSSRDAYIQRLRERGFVSCSGDAVVATPEGFAALPNAEPLPTGQELQDYWLRRLPEGERAILELLIREYPEAVPRLSIDEITGYKRSSRDAYLQRMRAKQLIEEIAGAVRASENLF